ncbi:MAG: hypothetical protein IJK31_00380 [Ruminococcus sp.]|nr:hypothetical protein [Ruminococcus sp.]
MQVISHFPKSIESQKVLSKNLAEFQARSVIDRIQRMNLTEEETKRLITMICDKVQIAAGT